MFTIKLNGKQVATLLAALHAQKDFWVAAIEKADDDAHSTMFNQQLKDVNQLIKILEEE